MNLAQHARRNVHPQAPARSAIRPRWNDTQPQVDVDGQASAGVVCASAAVRPARVASCTHASQHSQHESLGYQTALDLGVSAMDAGATRAAVGYLSDAVAVRPTRFALVRLATALRDQGQLELARQRLLQARALPDGEDPT